VAPPVRIAPYYLFIKVLGLSGNIWESQAPPPLAGAGLAHGEKHRKKGFLQSSNYFIRQFYPALTMTTSAEEIILGKFGGFIAVFSGARALVFWHVRDRVPKLPG
jgi:hypothetical protein